MPDQTPQLPSANELAMIRTCLAQERTLMAWIRTATSLISFGFTIFKFFQFEAGKEHAAAARHLVGPREFALIMIVTGLLSLLLATVGNRRRLQAYRAAGAQIGTSEATVVASLVAVLGLVALFSVLLER